MFQLANLTIAAAEKICAANSSCAAFTFEGNVSCGVHFPSSAVRIYKSLRFNEDAVAQERGTIITIRYGLR